MQHVQRVVSKHQSGQWCEKCAPEEEVSFKQHRLYANLFFCI